MKAKISDHVLPLLGVLIFISAFFVQYWMPDLTISLFDIICHTGLMIFLVRRYDLPSLLLFSFLGFRIYDEITCDDGVIDHIDIIELILLITITTYNFLKYKTPARGN